jgi:hypothetical protein
MKKNLLITFFLTAIITHFPLYCSERPTARDEKAKKEAAQKKLSIEARWKKLLEINPYQARPMPVSAAQPAHAQPAHAQPAHAQPVPVFKAAPSVQLPPVQGFPSVQPIPAAPQHILAVQAARPEELPLKVFFAKEDYEAWQKLEQYLKELERRFPFNNHQISEIIKQFAWAKKDCALTFYLKRQTEKNNPDANQALDQAIGMFNKFRRAVDQGKEGVPNIIDPIEKYLGDTHYYKNVLVPGNTPPATQSGVICHFCAKVFNRDYMLKRHVRNSHQVEEAHKKDLANKTTSDDITVSKI